MNKALFLWLLLPVALLSCEKRDRFAKAHPDVCRFDLAFMESATGRPIQHMECLLRGGHACRFRIGRGEP